MVCETKIVAAEDHEALPGAKKDALLAAAMWPPLPAAPPPEPQPQPPGGAGGAGPPEGRGVHIREFRAAEQEAACRIFYDGIMERVPNTAFRGLRQHPRAQLLCALLAGQCGPRRSPRPGTRGPPTPTHSGGRDPRPPHAPPRAPLSAAAGRGGLPPRGWPGSRPRRTGQGRGRGNQGGESGVPAGPWLPSHRVGRAGRWRGAAGLYITRAGAAASRPRVSFREGGGQPAGAVRCGRLCAQDAAGVTGHRALWFVLPQRCPPFPRRGA